MLAVGVLLAAVLLRVLLIGLLVPYMLAAPPGCPACGTPGTERVAARWSWLVRAWAEYRWCIACGWSGLTRR